MSPFFTQLDWILNKKMIRALKFLPCLIVACVYLLALASNLFALTIGSPFGSDPCSVYFRYTDPHNLANGRTIVVMTGEGGSDQTISVGQHVFFSTYTDKGKFITVQSQTNQLKTQINDSHFNMCCTFKVYYDRADHITWQETCSK
jgi:hypothetical protein